ncbi:hypothetical protein IV38_GL001710 [Lactobacillus selangorensis]|uniref:Septum formation initiator n=1 Tax=Lactobacillus selangorensis TaxID=81857 RepID=A0A0R2FGX9_9LACO|nr:septum formation initiator family protein [Lactobacillus selangorensis]KRN27871.1 hypothetical protein IV38_GL001710 [Lactobacillus selangorensis]KRN30658.1 hypothetical protein IV40_GL001845 [Lactobacillus selangorensis]
MTKKSSSGKVASLRNAYTEQFQDQQQHAQRTDYVRSVHKRRIWLLTGILLVIFLIGGFQLIRSHQTLATTNQQVVVQKKKLNNIKGKQDDLKIEVKELKNDDYVGKLIRYKYYYSKKGEKVYSLPQDNTPVLNQKAK